MPFTTWAQRVVIAPHPDLLVAAVQMRL